MSHPFERLFSDLRSRYPSTADDGPAEPVADLPAHDEAHDLRMRHLPKEVGTLLVAIGVAGLLLPGPVGSPFVVAGGLILWPEGFSRVESWFSRRFPAMHRNGVKQVDRYLDDLERRFPGSTGEAA